MVCFLIRCSSDDFGYLLRCSNAATCNLAVDRILQWEYTAVLDSIHSEVVVFVFQNNPDFLATRTDDVYREIVAFRDLEYRVEVEIGRHVVASLSIHRIADLLRIRCHRDKATAVDRHRHEYIYRLTHLRCRDKRTFHVV